MIKITTFVDYKDKFYTKNMKIFVKPTDSIKPKTGESQTATYMYVAILVIFALAQLFSFDEFIVLIESFKLPNYMLTAQILASIIVVLEVLSLPFLLRLKLSPRMRIISMVFGWLVPIVWLKLTLWLVFTSPAVTNIGFLGTVIDLIPGWWAVFISLAMGLLAAWASWGMWPTLNKAK